MSAGDWLSTWGGEAAPLGHGEARLQPEVGRGVTGTRAPLPLWNWKSTYGPTVMATVMAPRSKKNPQEHPPLPSTEFLEMKQLPAFMVRNVCNGDIPNLEACQRQSQPEDG